MKALFYSLWFSEFGRGGEGVIFERLIQIATTAKASAALHIPIGVFGVNENISGKAVRIIIIESFITLFISRNTVNSHVQVIFLIIKQLKLND